jgi:putative acetyltransferase
LIVELHDYDILFQITSEKTMRTIELKLVLPDDKDLQCLISSLDKELLTLYPAEGIFGVDFLDPKVSEMTFCVAIVNGTPAGCGALKPLDGNVAELKRFFVVKPFRGKGIASAVLDYIEGVAKDRGIVVIRLETGPRQPEAIGLYRKFGYNEIEPYGQYIGCQYSYCMEKDLV